MHGEKYILAIDLGTTGPKVALVTVHGEVVDFEFESTRLFLSPGGGAEQCPGEWWDAIVKATARLLDRQLVNIDEIFALSCTGQWSGTVAVEREGSPLMNAITWMDTRGAKYIKQITSGTINIQGYGLVKLARWIRLSGGIPGRAGKDPTAHILFIKNELPHIYSQTYKFLEPKDYINMRLTGRFVASFDSICLHWLTDNRRIDRIDYEPSLISMTGIDSRKLPELKRAVDILGLLREEPANQLGLKPDIPVIVGTPDVHSAAIGSGAVMDGIPHLYLGTSSWIACHLPYKKADLLHNMASLPSAVPGKYLLIAEQECAGACLIYLRDNLIFPDDPLSTGLKPEDALDSFNMVAAQVPPGSDGLVFTPWLYGERVPVDDAYVRGGFINQSLKTTRSHLIRAAFEGVAYNTRWSLNYVEKFIKQRLEDILVVGGGAKSDFWCQVFADVLNRRIMKVKDPILANVRGAALLAAAALGHLPYHEIPRRVQIANTFEPDPSNRRIYDELYREFVSIYKRLKPIYTRLNRSVAVE